jgi:hypothetical protein
MVKQYLTETITNTLMTVTDPYLTQKLFLTTQKTQPVTISNTKRLILLSVPGAHPTLKLPCPYKRVITVFKKACNWPPPPTQSIPKIKIRRSGMLGLKPVNSLAWHPTVRRLRHSRACKPGYPAGRTVELKHTIRETQASRWKEQMAKRNIQFLYFSTNLCSETSHIFFSTALPFQ